MKKYYKMMLGAIALIVIQTAMLAADSSIELADDVTLTNISKKTGNWTKTSKAFCKHIALPGNGKKNYCLNMDIPANAKKKTAAWQFNTRYNKALGAGEIQVSFRARMDAVKSIASSSHWSCFYSSLIGHVEKDAKIKYKNFKGLRIGTGSNDWKEYSFNYMLPSAVTDISLKFVLQECTGKVFIDDLSIKFIPVSKKCLDKAISLRVMGGKKTVLLPKRRAAVTDKSFVASQEEKRNGYVVFKRNNPRDTYSYSIPSRKELVKQLALFATPGEKEPVWMGVYALKDIQGINISVSELVGENGQRISKNKIKAKLVHCWPQGTTASAAGDDNTYAIIPELLLPLKTFAVHKNSAVNVYFLVSVPENAVAGIYKSTITVKPENAPASKIKLVLKVLPFSLKKPDRNRMSWLIHTTTNFKALTGKDSSAHEAALKVCEDVKKHGIDGLVLPCVYGRDTIKLTQNNGKLQIASFGKLERMVPAMIKAGMKGPLIIHFGDILEYEVAKAMKYDLPTSGQKGGVSTAMKSQAFKKAYANALNEVDKLVKKLGENQLKWYFMGIDEPGSHHRRQERAIWEWSLAQKTGFQGAVYMHGTFWKKLAPFNYIQIFNSSMYRNRTETEKLLLELKKYNNIPFQYGASGSYGRIPGGLMPSRWGTGFFAYATKIKGQVSWLYSLHAKVDPAQTGHMNFYPTITYAGKDGNIISTLQWEGIREGIDDYCYLITLEAAIKKAKTTGALAKKAEIIEKKLKLLLEKVPFFDNYRCDDSSEKADFSSFSNATASILRYQIALWIMELDSGKAK